MRTFVDDYRDQGLKMVQGCDYMIFEIDCQNEDRSLTNGPNRRLMEAIRSLTQTS